GRHPQPDRPRRPERQGPLRPAAGGREGHPHRLRLPRPGAGGPRRRPRVPQGRRGVHRRLHRCVHRAEDEGGHRLPRGDASARVPDVLRNLRGRHGLRGERGAGCMLAARFGRAIHGPTHRPPRGTKIAGMSLPEPELAALATPLAWSDPEVVVAGCNPAFASWLGVGARRVVGRPLASLDAEEPGRLQAAIDRLDTDAAPLRLRRVHLRHPEAGERFADLWLSGRDGGGVLVEAHPVDEFPGDDPALLPPSALSATLKGLAHELRNPLPGLKGAAQLLGRRVAPADRELVGLVGEEVSRLSGLVDRLLHPQAPVPHGPVNIHAVLERVLRLAESDAGWAVRLVRDYDPSLPELEGDADRLVQALWNLVRNAIQAGAGTVTLRTRAEHGLRLGEQA